MPRFFFTSQSGTTAYITGEDAGHISRVLRLNIGATLELCDGAGYDYTGTISDIQKDRITVLLSDKTPSQSEPKTDFVLFQGLSKGDRMETVIQKSVELGVSAIIPVAMKRSVAKGDKPDRWQKIATAAAKQSGRGRIPQIAPLINSRDVIAQIRDFDLFLLPYENGGQSLQSILCQTTPQRIGIWIGPEGGFDESEILAAKDAKIITLGKRILRTETAGPAVLAALSYALGEWE